MRIDDFIGRVSQYGFARNHRWTITFGRTDINSRRLSDMCKSVTIPSRAMEFNEQKIYGPARNLAGGGTYGDELKMEFMCGNDMYERQIFSSWMDTMVNPITNNPNYYSSYICDVTIKMHDFENNLRYALKFYEVYPTSIDSYDLVQAGDDPFVSVGINFGYRKFVTLQGDVAAEQGEEQQADTDNQETTPQRTEQAKAKPDPNPSDRNPRRTSYYEVNGRSVTKEEYDEYNAQMEARAAADRAAFDDFMNNM